MRTIVPIRDQARIICSHLSRRKVLAMFKLFLDDSGTHAGGLSVVLAGYLAPLDEWEPVESRWLGMLGQAEIDHYHSTDASHRKGLLVGRSRDYCNDLHRQAVTILAESSLIPVGVSIAEAAERAEGLSDIRACYSDLAWFVGGYMAEKAPDDLVSAIIEEGSGTSSLQELHRTLRADPKYADRLARFDSGPAPKEKAKHLGLQMADVLAYELHLDTRRTFYEPTGHRRGSWKALTEQSDRVGGHLTHWRKTPD